MCRPRCSPGTNENLNGSLAPVDKRSISISVLFVITMLQSLLDRVPISVEQFISLLAAVAMSREREGAAAAM